MTATMERTPLGLGIVGTELQVLLSEHLPDGHVMTSGDLLLIGTGPLSVTQAAAREARLLVRRGMADVLTWLGRPVYTEPTSEEILDSLFRQGRLDR